MIINIQTPMGLGLKLKVSIFSVVLAVAAVSATLTITAATHDLTGLAFAQGGAKFGFNLTGSEEVPPVETDATGMADISAYTIASDSITYNVNATNIEDVTAGHIHFGKPGENGPIVFTMFKYGPSMDEVLESGTITADKLEGPMEGKKVSDLAFAGANGSLYMNIHTVEHPDGEIRGTSSIPP
ncbi:MAG: CHRD domain-containing protein [Nitrososphaeraceae archaeon]